MPAVGWADICLTSGTFDLRPGAQRATLLQDVVAAAHEANAKVCVATDLLALTLLTPPGEWGADIVVGSAQRLGVPLGYGGPHAAFLACHDSFKRNMAGRIIGARSMSTLQFMFLPNMQPLFV